MSQMTRFGKKMNPLSIHIFDVNRGKVATQLLDMCLTSSFTAESIFPKLADTLQHFEAIGKCVAFSADNTSVNLGRRNSIRQGYFNKTHLHILSDVPAIWFIILLQK